MRSVAEALAQLTPNERQAALSVLSDAEAEALLYDWRGFLARDNQVMPEGDWEIWMVLAGRGFGKTRTGAEAVREEVRYNRSERIGLIAETAADARDVMVSELLRIFPPDERPLYTKSNRCVEFHNGAKAFTYNATEPDQLRGPQHDFLWHDELAKWRYARETWDQAQFGLRLGRYPRQIVTTTPRPIELVKAIVAGTEGKVHVTRGSTMDNASNLAGSFLSRIKKRYEGTRLGRQELNAEILGDMPGALWSQASIDAHRRGIAPPRDRLKRVVVAVDPAVTSEEDSNYHGITVQGVTVEDEGLVLQDESIQGTPADWARRAVSLYKSNHADCIVVEVNQGGDMVEHTIKTVDSTVNVRQVRATKGKHIRAEPISALYEQGRIAHVGQFAELEAQMTQMTNEGYQGEGSPDRVDAMVWGFTELFPDINEPIETERSPPPPTGAGWMGA